MPTVLARFDPPEDVTTAGLDGKAIRFPFAFIEAQHVGTPRQTSETKTERITVEISRTLISIWNLNHADLIKVLFQIAKEHLVKRLGNSKRVGRDVKIQVNTSTHEGPCPFDPQFIEAPNGAADQFEVTRPIGFVWDA